MPIVTNLLFEIDGKRLSPIQTGTEYDVFDGESGSLVISIRLTDGWEMLGCTLECKNSHTGAKSSGGTRTGNILEYEVDSRLLSVGTLSFHLRGAGDNLVLKTDDWNMDVYRSFDVISALVPITPSQYDLLSAEIGALEGQWGDLLDEIDDDVYDGYSADWSLTGISIPTDSSGEIQQNISYTVALTLKQGKRLVTGVKTGFSVINRLGYSAPTVASVDAVDDETARWTISFPSGSKPYPCDFVGLYATEGASGYRTEINHWITTVPAGQTGAQGPKGDTGATGAKGDQGIQGVQGSKGDKGDKGDTGTIFTPSVSSDGVISWTNNGDLDNPSSINITGPQGPQGESGVYVGTSEPSDEGANVWVNPSGSDIVAPVKTLTGAIQSLELQSDTIYRCADRVSNLTVTGFGVTDGVASIWTVQFTAADTVAVTLPDGIVWEPYEPVFTPGCSYRLTWTQNESGYNGAWIEREPERTTEKEVSGQGKASWEDGVKSYLPSATLYGATGQNTLTGSNLFDVKAVINVNAQDDISFDPSTSSKNFYNLPTVAGQTYTVSFEIKTTGTEAQPNALAISVQDGQNQAYNASNALALLLGVPLDWGRKTIQFTAASEWTSLVTTIVHMRYFQVNAGETALDYEPYCGGIPAPNPSYPIEPKCNSALYAARGKNLVNIPDDRIRFESYYYTTTLTSFVLKAGQTYTLSFDYQIHSATQTVRCGLVYYDDSGNRKQLAGDINYPNQTAGRFTGTFTVPESLLFEPAKLMLYLVRMSYAGDADVSVSNVMLEFGGTASDYSPYWDGGTVTAPALHGFPGVEACDEWDAVTGQGIRRAHVIALDGTENWVHASDDAYYTTGYPRPLTSYTETVGYCTHVPYAYNYDLGSGFMVGYNGTLYNYRNDLWPTLDEWKSFLVAQAEAGTPVQVVYVMEEPQSFFFPPQERLSAPAGVGQLVQQGGVIPDTNITVRYLTHS